MMNAVAEFVMQWWLYVALLVGIVVAALASGLETGLYRLNRIRLRLRIESGDARAKVLQTLLADLRGMIIVSLIGVACGQYLVTVVVTTLVASAGWTDSTLAVELLATLILMPLLFVLTDVVPKSIFVAEADHWMYPMARPVRRVYRALRAVGILAAMKGISNLVVRIAHRGEAEAAEPFHPRQRLRAILGEGAAEGVISRYQHELVNKVLSLRERLVREVMIPMGRVAAVPVTIDRGRFIEELRKHSFTRLPVWEGKKENVIGIVRINDVLAAGDSFDLASMMSRDFVAVPPDMTVSHALLEMQKARTAIALVRDDKGRTVGLITIKDLVEEIVGELAAW
jgi:CBS domain containing-hemolysin-like protein